MKCRKCGHKAIINMRQHKLALCKDHFPEWIIEQTGRTIKKYKMFGPQDKILVAVSGGKDSLALWDILNQMGYQTDGLYIGLGIDDVLDDNVGLGYSEKSMRLTKEFAKNRDLKLTIVDFPGKYGESIPDIAQRTQRGRGKPCSVCGLTKRHIMNREARDGNYDVLVTGHNLDDEAATLFGNTINWLENYLLKQSPVLEASPGLVRKTKPLMRFYEREMAAYALLRGIEYIQEECPFSLGASSIRYKEILNQLEIKSPGAKQYFYLGFLKAKDKGFFVSPEELVIDPQNICPTCGQMTHADGNCSFCRMLGNGTPGIL
ncbi:ATP-binding protein [Chloroflexota bacterium]